MEKLLLFITTLLFAGNAMAQQNGHTYVDGKKMEYIIDECGDTLLVANLNDISISSPVSFDNSDEYKRYRKYRRYAVKVHPYAVEAIRIFKEVEYATETMKKRERKKYLKKLQKDLKKEFADPLKKLTKTQGYILVKMIEKELDTPMYELIKDLRGAFTASYWNTFGRTFGYRLKDGYVPGEDKILDAVLNDLWL
ncbi:MAG: DUF4294 domain-containing protein [Bacteroidetes bacterium]|nr:MAG: DUF4294 domain-containing protein [Bacteroidota bacterium]